MSLELFLPFISMVFKGILYYAALKIQKLEARLLTCALCGGASLLASYIPFPIMLQLALTIAIAAYFIVKNSDADLYPNGVGIPLAVEIVGAFALSYVVVPLLELI